MPKTSKGASNKAPSFDHNFVFTDGACSGNPGPGGWAAIVAMPDGQVTELGDHAPETTNNRMEMIAVCRGLEFLKDDPRPTAVYTDSTYMIRGASQWIHGWKRRGWKTAEGATVSNLDLWQWADQLLILEAKKGPIQWHYLRGHSGTPANERADEIAVAFSKKQHPKLYQGSLLSYDIALFDLPEDTSLPPMKDRKDNAAQKPLFYLSLVNGQLKRHATWKECEAEVKGRSGARFKKISSPAEEQEILRKWGVGPS